MNTSQNNLFIALREIGVDVDGTISRFMDNDELYVRFIARFPDEDRITPIKAAVSEKDTEKIISTAHKLKGVSANLGMTELSAKAAKIVEKARNGETEGYDEDIAQVERLSQQVCSVIRAYV